MRREKKQRLSEMSVVFEKKRRRCPSFLLCRSEQTLVKVLARCCTQFQQPRGLGVQRRCAAEACLQPYSATAIRVVLKVVPRRELHTEARNTFPTGPHYTIPVFGVKLGSWRLQKYFRGRRRPSRAFFFALVCLLNCHFQLPCRARRLPEFYSRNLHGFISVLYPNSTRSKRKPAVLKITPHATLT